MKVKVYNIFAIVLFILPLIILGVNTIVLLVYPNTTIAIIELVLILLATINSKELDS